MDKEEILKIVNRIHRETFGGHTISNPKKVVVSESPRIVWSMGWWLSQKTGKVYLLIRKADVDSFTREEADGLPSTR